MASLCLALLWTGCGGDCDESNTRESASGRIRAAPSATSVPAPPDVRSAKAPPSSSSDEVACFVLNAFDFDGDGDDDAFSFWLTTADGDTTLWDEEADGLVDVVEHEFAPKLTDPADLDRRFLYFPSHYGSDPGLGLGQRLRVYGALLAERRRRLGGTPQTLPNTALERFTWADGGLLVHWRRWRSSARQRAHFARFDGGGRPILEGFRDESGRHPRIWNVWRYYDRSGTLIEVQRRHPFGGHRVRLGTDAASGVILERHDGAPRGWLRAHFADPVVRPVQEEVTMWPRTTGAASGQRAPSRDPVADFRRLATRRRLDLRESPTPQSSDAKYAGAHRLSTHRLHDAVAITTLAAERCPETDAVDLRFARANDAAQRALARYRAGVRDDAAQGPIPAAPAHARYTIGEAPADASAEVVACMKCSAADLDALADFAQLRALRIQDPRPSARRPGRALPQVRYLALYAGEGNGIGAILGRFPNLRGLLLATDKSSTPDLAVLSQLRRLRRLDLGANGPATPPVLSSLVELEELRLHGGTVSSLAPLLAQPPPRLRRLLLDNAPSGLDLSRLSTLEELWVNCRHDGRFDMGVLEHLPALRTLSTTSCPLDRPEVLAKGSRLERLSLEPASAEAAAAAVSIEGLRVLRLRVTDADHRAGRAPALHRLGHLRVLELAAAMRDLTVLGGHPRLEILRVGSPELAGLDGIAHLTSLTQLHVDPGERLRDISALAGLARLRRLTITAPNRIDDLGALSKLRQLESATIECPPAADLSPLRGLARLQYLSLGGDNPAGGRCMDFDARGKRDLAPLRTARRLTHVGLDVAEPGAERLGRALPGLGGVACGVVPECVRLFGPPGRDE